MSSLKLRGAPTPRRPQRSARFAALCPTPPRGGTDPAHRPQPEVGERTPAARCELPAPLPGPSVPARCRQREPTPRGGASGAPAPPRAARYWKERQLLAAPLLLAAQSSAGAVVGMEGNRGAISTVEVNSNVSGYTLYSTYACAFLHENPRGLCAGDGGRAQLLYPVLRHFS